MFFILYLIFFLLAINVLVFVHELGHYMVAKWSGAKVLEFAIGMGPTLFKRTDIHGTTWSFKLFPVGGYVLAVSDGLIESVNEMIDDFEAKPIEEQEKISAELASYNLTTDYIKNSNPKDSIDSKKTPVKLLFSMGGIIMNFLLIWVSLFIAYNNNGKRVISDEAYFVSALNIDGYPEYSTTTSFPITQTKVVKWTGDQSLTSFEIHQAIVAGEAIEDKDFTYIINSPEGVNYTSFKDDTFLNKDYIPLVSFSFKFFNNTTASFEGELNMETKGSNQLNYIGDVKYSSFDKLSNEEKIIKNVNFTNSHYYASYSFQKMFIWQAFGESFVDSWKLIAQGARILLFMFWPKVNDHQVNSFFDSSTIYHSRFLGLSLNYYNLYNILALLSALLLVFNILPIPPLDGYRFVVYLFEGTTKKKMSSKTASKIDKIGWIFIMVITLWIYTIPFLI